MLDVEADLDPILSSGEDLERGTRTGVVVATSWLFLVLFFFFWLFFLLLLLSIAVQIQNLWVLVVVFSVT